MSVYGCLLSSVVMQDLFLKLSIGHVLVVGPHRLAVNHAPADAPEILPVKLLSIGSGKLATTS